MTHRWPAQNITNVALWPIYPSGSMPWEGGEFLHGLTAHNIATHLDLIEH